MTQIILIAVLVFIALSLWYLPVSLWLAAVLAGLRISLVDLILMKLRGSPVKEIVRCLIATEKAGIPLERVVLEAYALGGGNVNNVVNGMVMAHFAGQKLSFDNARKADEQGIDIVKALKEDNEQKQMIDFD